MASKKKPLFHSPQKTGEVIPVPSNLPMKIISVVSLAVLAGLFAFAIIAANAHSGTDIALYGNFIVPAGVLFFFFPVVGLIIALGFRLALKLIPLEMWRLPSGVRDATIRTKGKYLRFATLLIELETLLMFFYITYALNLGQEPGDLPVLLWVVAVIATIVIFGRYAVVEAGKVR